MDWDEILYTSSAWSVDVSNLPFIWPNPQSAELRALGNVFLFCWVIESYYNIFTVLCVEDEKFSNELSIQKKKLFLAEIKIILNVIKYTYFLKPLFLWSFLFATKL